MRRIVDVAAITPGISLGGRGAGAKTGEWELAIVNGGDIEDDDVSLDHCHRIWIDQSWRTERHLVRSHDVLVTAKSTKVKAALMPALTGRVVANSTLLVVRPLDPDMGPYLWWYVTSKRGRAEVEARVVPSTTLSTLSAQALGEVPVPIPDARELYRLADLIAESERAYRAGRDAAEIRRRWVRDGIIEALRAGALEEG